MTQQQMIFMRPHYTQAQKTVNVHCQ